MFTHLNSLLRTAIVRQSVAAIVMSTAAISFTGCGIQATHPGQISKFDGAAFDSLLLAHGALNSLRAPIAADYPTLVPSYNRTADAFNHAVAIYGLYRLSKTTELNSTVTITELVTALIAFETDIQTSFNIKLNSHEARMAQRVASTKGIPGFSVDALITELQLAASIAAAVTGDSAQLRAAAVILTATQQAMNEYNAASNKAIDMGMLASLTSIEVKAAQ